jgi:hypothetical protein
MADVQIDISADPDPTELSVEFGGYSGEVELSLPGGLTVIMNYATTEKLWKELSPYFVAPNQFKTDLPEDDPL